MAKLTSVWLKISLASLDYLAVGRSRIGVGKAHFLPKHENYFATSALRPPRARWVRFTQIFISLIMFLRFCWFSVLDKSALQQVSSVFQAPLHVFVILFSIEKDTAMINSKLSTFPSFSFVRLPQIILDSRSDPPVPAMIPVGRSTWWQWVRDDKAPAPVKLGPRTTAWWVVDILALVERLGGGDS